MARRLIVRIDDSRCDGCGACVPACAEGALVVVDGKVRLEEERLCDGLGACIGQCPRGALLVEEREALDFDERAVAEHLRPSECDHRREECEHGEAASPSACPGSRVLSLAPALSAPTASPSALGNWPVQLMLVPVKAPYLRGADLLVAADCVPFAFGGFHRDLLPGRVLVVGCPKLDDAQRYVDKLAAIIHENDLQSITVAHMEVPCCYGLGYIVDQALARSGRSLPIRDVTVTVQGKLVGDVA